MIETPELTEKSQLGTIEHVTRWLGATVVVVLLATVCGVVLPSRIKLLGLFPLAWGAAVGCGVRYLADRFHVKSTGWRTVVVLVGLAAGEAGIVLGGWGLYRFDLRKQFDRIPSLGFPSADLLQGKADLPKEKAGSTGENQSTEDYRIPSAKNSLERHEQEAELEAKVLERQQIQLQLGTFLYRRILRLGEFPAPWPYLFWLSEILFGTWAGFWCWKNVRMQETSANQNVGQA